MSINKVRSIFKVKMLLKLLIVQLYGLSNRT
jgi:hypothetical protein